MKKLNLEDFERTSIPTAMALSHLLKSSRSLTDFTVHLGAAETRYVFDGLKTNTSLKNVYVSGELLSPEDVLPILSLFEENNTIELFSLSMDSESSRAIDLSGLVRGLMDNTAVKKFELCVVRLGFPLGPAARDVLKKNTTLQHVSLSVHAQSDINHIAEGLNENGTLESLELTLYADFEVSLVDLLVILLGALQSQTSRLKSIRIDIQGAVWSRVPRSSSQPVNRLQLLLQGCSVLRKIDLCNAYTDEMDEWLWQETLGAIFAGLSGGSSVDTLCLNGIEVLDDVTSPKLVELLTSEHSSLKSLTLEGNKAEAFDAMARAVKHSACRLKDLKVCVRINRHSLSDKSVRMILSADNLTSVELTGLGDSAAKVVAATLEARNSRNGNKSLSTLGLDRCNIGNDGAKDIARVLLVDKALKDISLVCNRIGDDGAKSIGQIIPKNTTLKRINLIGNMFGEDGIHALVAGLEANTSIEEFDGIPNEFPKEQKQAEFYTALNKADRKSYLEAENMPDDKWVESLKRFEDCGDLSTLFFAVRSKPDFVCVRPDSKPSATSLGKRKRDEDYQ